MLGVSFDGMFDGIAGAQKLASKTSPLRLLSRIRFGKL